MRRGECKSKRLSISRRRRGPKRTYCLFTRHFSDDPVTPRNLSGVLQKYKCLHKRMNKEKNVEGKETTLKDRKVNKVVTNGNEEPCKILSKLKNCI